MKLNAQQVVGIQYKHNTQTIEHMEFEHY